MIRKAAFVVGALVVLGAGLSLGGFRIARDG
jgi:hypothetical protein